MFSFSTILKYVIKRWGVCFHISFSSKHSPEIITWILYWYKGFMCCFMCYYIYIYSVILNIHIHIFFKCNKKLRLSISYYNTLTVSHSYILGETYTDFYLKSRSIHTKLLTIQGRKWYFHLYSTWYLSLSE